ncbi:orotate phosphoribosyltransferase [Fulvivirgaceae bacterium PWU4]|uniref:Orotate phosphoribosyltransferase n=1 Tax=Chryseosolibacter histidini TaxID=2782349 RepID=A0AAP2DV25_9BACT|nr:orotate phosphoribosyltransferase [Chryseosolibacter histidini]MBT1701234.1 orotate phosphoribosyltransferase [Chryseosolibacter histidini]
MPIIKVQSETASKVAEMLLQIEAIKLNTEKPFTWSSGWKSPIYCDNRLSLSYPDVRNVIKAGLISAIRENFFTAESIAGVATAGIAQGAIIADAMNLPFLYVRPKPKDHGMENLIEGKITKGQQVVVIEDLVSTGGSSLKTVTALRDAGFKVLGMVSIFNYGFDIATRNFYEADVSLISLSDYSHLLTQALNEKYITESQITSLKAWRVDPSNWKKA